MKTRVSLKYFVTDCSWVKKKYHFEMEKIALILIYLTWFSSSFLHSTSCVYFPYIVHATIINLAHLNSYSLQLAG